MTSSQYSALDTFEIRVKYVWLGTTYKDYTVKTYSSMDLVVRDSMGRQVMLNADGQSPSEYTSSSYKGMSGTFTSVPPGYYQDQSSLNQPSDTVTTDKIGRAHV